ncbi:MAG: transposase [Adhaeribacter sp.]|nr:transposase [Adhaeribacter sp.]
MDKFTDRICQRQHLIIRRLAVNRNEEIQFGHFISNQHVAVSALEQQFYLQFRTGCPDSGHLLLIEDTSQMAFSLNRKVKELGKVDKGQGFYLHPVLGPDADNGACYGIASVTFLKRAFTAEKCTRQQVSAQRDKTAFEEKEGYRWYSPIVSALENCHTTVAKTVVADR